MFAILVPHRGSMESHRGVELNSASSYLSLPKNNLKAQSATSVRSCRWPLCGTSDLFLNNSPRRSRAFFNSKCSRRIAHNLSSLYAPTFCSCSSLHRARALVSFAFTCLFTL